MLIASISTAAATDDRPSADVLFERELGPCRRQLYPTALRMTGTSSDAEDLVQDTMTRAYAGLAGFKPGTNGRARLFRIMANAFINICRHRQHEPVEVLRSTRRATHIARRPK